MHDAHVITLVFRNLLGEVVHHLVHAGLPQERDPHKELDRHLGRGLVIGRHPIASHQSVPVPGRGVVSATAGDQQKAVKTNAKGGARHVYPPWRNESNARDRSQFVIRDVFPGIISITF